MGTIDLMIINTYVTTYRVGRPRDATTVEDILELRQLNFKWTKIAEMLHISRSTLYRRLNDAGISTERDTLVSDQQLDATITPY